LVNNISIVTSHFFNRKFLPNQASHDYNINRARDKKNMRVQSLQSFVH